jgi:hypothetical protein
LPGEANAYFASPYSICVPRVMNWNADEISNGNLCPSSIKPIR